MCDICRLLESLGVPEKAAGPRIPELPPLHKLLLDMQMQAMAWRNPNRAIYAMEGYKRLLEICDGLKADDGTTTWMSPDGMVRLVKIMAKELVDAAESLAELQKEMGIKGE